MAEVNLFCDVRGCGEIAQNFAIRGKTKEKCCERHLQEFAKKGTIIDISGYHFISSIKDVEEFDNRRKKADQGLGYLTVLEAQCDSEFFEAEKVLDASEQKVSAIMTRCFREIKRQVQHKFETIKQELAVLRSNFDQYLTSRSSELTDSAQKLCESVCTPLKWIMLMNEDCSVEVGKAISRSWRISTESTGITLACLDEEKRAAALERLATEANELLREGHAQFALQLSLYAQELGWSGDIEEAKKANLSKQFENLIHLQALFPLADFDKATAQEVAAKCLEAGLSAKSKMQFNESAEWLQKAWELYAKIGSTEASAAGLALGEVLGLCCGKYAEAEKVVRQCYSLATQLDLEELTEPRARGEEALRASTWIAGLYFHGGRWQDAVDVSEWVLNSFDSSYPAMHFWTILLYLTYSCWHLGSGERARNVAEAWRERQLGEESALSETLKVMVFAASALERNDEEAEKMLASVLPNQQAPVFAAINHSSMGALHYVLERWNESEKHLKRAKEIYDAVSPLSINAAINLSSMGLLYKALNMADEAEEHHKRAKEIYDIVSPQSISAANNLNHMGTLYYLEQPNKAEEYFKRAKEVYDAVSPLSISAAKNLNSMGVLYSLLERWSEAVEHLEHAKNIYNVASPNSIDTAINLDNLSAAYEAMGKAEEAIDASLAAKRIFAINHENDWAEECELRVQRLRPSVVEH